MRRVLSLYACCFFLLCGQAYADFESEVIDLVNVERAAEGLAPLNYDARLAAAARDHSEDMGLQDYFSHTSLDGRTVSERIEDAGYSWNTYGENIAAGQPTPEDVIDSWMSSQGHRANILNPNFCDIGVGYTYVADSFYRITGRRILDAKAVSVPVRKLPPIQLPQRPAQVAVLRRKETSR